MHGKLALLWCGVLLVLGTTTLVAQEFPAQGDPLTDAFSGLGDPMADPLLGGVGPRVTFAGSFQVTEGTRDGMLSVRAETQPGWHVYSISQAPGGPRRTEITVANSPEFQVVGDFEADRDPHFTSDEVFPDVTIEEHEGEVTWSAPIQLAEGVVPEQLTINLTISGQVCTTGGACDPINQEPVAASFSGYQQATSAAGKYVDPSGHVTIQGHVEPKVAAPGDTVKLILTAELEGEWHIYRYAATAPDTGSRPTLIVLRKVAGWEYGAPEPSVPAIQEQTGLSDEPVIYYHQGSVTWTIPIQVPRDAEAGDYALAGGIGYQTCTASLCDQPTGVNFKATIQVGPSSSSGQAALELAPAKYAAIAKDAQEMAKQQAKRKPRSGSDLDSMPLAGVLAIAFLAGLILNVMPCVLPVIGLKIMSFVHQAGGSRGEILALNLWFSLGLMSVFWILAAAAAFAGHTWGEHFADMRFLIAHDWIVFAFGLSFLGVWEIPIPGFVGSSEVTKAAQREGAVGAFSKGVLSTILATPCAGPLIGPAVGWAVKQPPALTFAAFTFIGLGMAAPYLLIGAMPGLVESVAEAGERGWISSSR